jgi:hypothetical protein
VWGSRGIALLILNLVGSGRLHGGWGLGGPQNLPLSSPYLLHSLHCSDCTQIIKLTSDCDGLTKKMKCICFVPNTGTVPAPRGCYVIALFCSKYSYSSFTIWLLCYCPADSDGFPICVKGFEGRLITEEGGIIHLTLWLTYGSSH